MRRAGLAVAIVLATAVAIVLLFGGRDVVPRPADRGTPRDVGRAVTSETSPRSPSPRSRAAKETPGDAPHAEHVARRIEGVVVEVPSETPLTGADVTIARRRGPQPREGFVDFELPGEPELRVKSSADGTFGVDVPSAGPWIVVARAADHADAATQAVDGQPVRLELAAEPEISFTVVRAKDDVPIPGAEVWVYGPDFKGVPQVLCVADERGVVRARLGRRATCVVRANGFATQFRAAPPPGGKVQLAPAYVVGGVVRDSAGGAVPGVVLWIPHYDRREWISDADGRFLIDDATAQHGGTCGIETDAAGFAPWYGHLIVGEVDAVVELKRWATVAGVVLLPDGTPAAGAEVLDLTTDAAGAFRASVGAGPQSISASWKLPGGGAFDAFSGAIRCDVAEGATLDGLVIRLTPWTKSYLVLRVVDGARRPVTDAAASVAGGVMGREVRGDVVVLGVASPPETELDVKIADYRPEGLRWSDRHATVKTQSTADGPATEIVLSPRREFTVEVIAPDGGTVPASVKPKLDLGEDWPWRNVARVRGDRTSATWSVDPAHRYLLTLDAKGFAKSRREISPEEIAAGRLAVCLESGATVRGRFVSTDPRAAAGARVHLHLGHLWLNDPERNEDGTFRFERVAGGAWRLDVRWPATVVVERDLQVTGSADLDLGDVVVPPAASVRGVVQRPDGRPCGGAVVRYCRTGSEESSPATVALQDGSFEIALPSVGNGALVASRRGFGAAVVDLVEADLGRPLVVRLVPEGRVDVRIRLPQQRPMTWSWSVRTPDGVRLPGAGEPMEDKIGYDDRHVVAGLAAGPVVVRIESLEWKYTADVTVVAGATVPVAVGPDR